MKINEESIRLWQEMADMTLSKCSGEYCDLAAENMEEAGEKLPPMPFVVDGKCVIPPHFRPLCAWHQCKIQSFGCDQTDPDWTRRYFELRDKLEETFG
jgi:hypothetical protein